MQAAETLIQGCTAVYTPELLRERLAQKTTLRVKVGFDPTAPDLHLGHAVLLNKVRAFQDLGHQVDLVVGNFTAAIGDPTGKNVTRPPLSSEVIANNAQTYCEQAFRILDPQKTTLHWNQNWLGNMNLEAALKLAAHSTVAQLLEREDFTQRYEAQKPIGVHEFFYPLLQGYDSVHLRSDVELGGTDQTFNLLMGRELQRQYGIAPQIVMTVPLLEGLDGVKKMSKSLDNYIGITEEPESQYGKLMSISDNLMWKYRELLLGETPEQIARHQRSIAQGQNPRDIKAEMAFTLVARYHTVELAECAQKQFITRFQKKRLPDHIEQEVLYLEPEQCALSQVMKALGAVPSTSRALTLIKQGGVKLNQNKVIENETLRMNQGYLLEVGKHFVRKIEILEKKG